MIPSTKFGKAMKMLRVRRSPFVWEKWHESEEDIKRELTRDPGAIMEIEITEHMRRREAQEYMAKFQSGGNGMTFQEVLAQLATGKAYKFYTPGMAGFFYKAPFPADPEQTELDGAACAITYWEMVEGITQRWSPTLMLYDFDGTETKWTCEIAFRHPALERRG